MEEYAALEKAMDWFDKSFQNRPRRIGNFHRKKKRLRRRAYFWVMTDVMNTMASVPGELVWKALGI